MSEKENFIISPGQLDLSRLKSLQRKPAPFTPGEPLFWDDPHISGQMLAVHLDPDTDLASRKPETIDKSVAWMMTELGLQAGDHLLDLGCGPGLYANRFAQLGVRVTGVDYSRRSIEYARNYAKMLDLDIIYRYQNYLDLEDEVLYDAAVLIFGDYCVLKLAERQKLLAKVHRALKPGGFFVLDVSTPHLADHQGEKSSWYASEAGFWRSTQHLMLENGFAYPDEMIYLDQYIVIEGDGSLTAYRNWFQDFDREMIVSELENAGFHVQSLWGELTGEPYEESSEWVGVVARRKP
ncbi:MAG: class I SAM-dependent methyltransferase [Brevefilum sp.]|nr:class I SAM-dependent methyltransferase [Brevefilum sp.]